MGKQIGIIPFRGTIDNLTFYFQEGQALVKKKSSLDKKRFMKDSSFEGSRRSAGRLANASKIGSRLYREFFPGARKKKKYYRLTGDATLLLKKGLSEEETLRLMRKKLAPPVKKKTTRKTARKKTANKIAKKKSANKKRQ